MLGSLLKALARRLLHIITLHYVDDYFGTDRDMSIEHAKLCFARLVRACLGQSAIASKKLEHGQCLVILGVEIRFSTHGATFWPSPEKVAKWCAEIEAALVANVQHFVRILSIVTCTICLYDSGIRMRSGFQAIRKTAVGIAKRLQEFGQSDAAGAD